MILTGENQRIQKKPCLSATLSTTNLTRTALGMITSLCGEKPANKDLIKMNGGMEKITQGAS
jgi:hypothetical protein